EAREMAFRKVVSNRRLKLVFNVEGAFELTTLKYVIGEDFLNLVGHSKVNNDIVAIFVENLLIIQPSKSDAILIVTHWVKPHFLGNLVSEVEKANRTFWVFAEEFRAKACVDVEIVKELERRNGKLLVFTEKLVEYGKDKKGDRARFKVSDIVALTAPFTLVSALWLKLRASTASAYDFLWCTQ
ncbi:hypothetical protein KI387_008843, partial [Taxus chinensis]